MTAFTADDFTQMVHNGVYGNKSCAVGQYANLNASEGTAAAGDTFDFVKIPAGATVVEGFIYTTQITGTCTLAIGIRAADGTSTVAAPGTGTAVLNFGTAVTSMVGGGVFVSTALKFAPFTNDFDTIAYATFVGATPLAANDHLGLKLDYIAKGSK